jgi:hypothetical protein
VYLIAAAAIFSIIKKGMNMINALADCKRDVLL